MGWLVCILISSKTRLVICKCTKSCGLLQLPQLQQNSRITENQPLKSGFAQLIYVNKILRVLGAGQGRMTLCLVWSGLVHQTGESYQKWPLPPALPASWCRPSQTNKTHAMWANTTPCLNLTVRCLVFLTLYQVFFTVSAYQYKFHIHVISLKLTLWQYFILE